MRCLLDASSAAACLRSSCPSPYSAPPPCLGLKAAAQCLKLFSDTLAKKQFVVQFAVKSERESEQATHSVAQCTLSASPTVPYPVFTAHCTHCLQQHCVPSSALPCSALLSCPVQCCPCRQASQDIVALLDGHNVSLLLS